MKPPIRKTNFVPAWIDTVPKIPVPKIDWIEDKKLDIPYGNHPLQKYDLYYPETKMQSPLPAVVIVHGGGFINNDKRDWHLYPGFFALKEGFALISVNYRLAPKHKYPDAETDLIDALLHIKAHAKEWGLDAENLCLYGTSAGGNLVSVVGLKGHSENTPYSVRCVAALCPLLSFSRIYNAVREKRASPLVHLLMYYICFCYLGIWASKPSDKMRLASAESYVGKTIPAFYLQTGTGDAVIDSQDVIHFYNLLSKTENASKENLVRDLLKDAPHAGAGPEYLESQNVLPILNFFKQNLYSNTTPNQLS